MNELLRTQNESWGFYGTMSSTGKSEESWNLAFNLLLKATKVNANCVRLFLDGTQGRHFADEVKEHLSKGVDLKTSIQTVIAKWKIWKVPKGIQKRYNIKSTYNYIETFALAYAIQNED